MVLPFYLRTNHIPGDFANAELPITDRGLRSFKSTGRLQLLRLLARYGQAAILLPVLPPVLPIEDNP
jgi:hypothetical protein